jgi:hypothetical protein
MQFDEVYNIAATNSVFAGEYIPRVISKANVLQSIYSLVNTILE